MLFGIKDELQKNSISNKVTVKNTKKGPGNHF